MTDAQIVNFAARLSTGQLEPAEMVGLSIDDFRKLLDHLGKHREWLLQQYVNSILASRTGRHTMGTAESISIWKSKCCRNGVPEWNRPGFCQFC
jgi:hypothetical protein